jgi:predicted dehydrogenase
MRPGRGRHLPKGVSHWMKNTHPTENIEVEIQFQEAAMGAVMTNTDEKTIKVALVGCGSRGTGAITQALRTRGPIKLWAMADLFADRLENSLALLVKGEQASYDREAHAGLGSQIDVPPERRFVGFDAYRQAIESGVDMVILTTPPHFRPMQFEFAVEQRKHVFMEKPLAVDASGIRRILAANEEAKKKQLKVGVGLMNRHQRGYQETVARIHAGAIGPIYLLRAYCNTSSMRDTAPRPPEMTEMLYQLRNPYNFIWLSGDYIVDNLLHFIDLCLWVKGEHPISAQGQGDRQIAYRAKCGDIFTHHAVEYTFADGAKMIATTRQIANCWNSTRSYADGLKGTADLGSYRIEGPNAWHFHGASPNPYQVEHDVLIEAIRQDKPHNDVEHGARSTMTAIMGRYASYSGKMVSWEQALNSEVRLAPEHYAFDATPPVVADAAGNYPCAIPGVSKVF